MNEDYLNENSKEFKAAKELEHALNDYGWNPKQFALATQTFHRTLQQSLFRTEDRPEKRGIENRCPKTDGSACRNARAIHLKRLKAIPHCIPRRDIPVKGSISPFFV